MEKTILNKSNSLLKSIDNMFKSVFGEREYVDKETNQINSEKDILILMNDGNDSKNANNDIDVAKNKKMSEILLSGLKEAEKYNYLINTPSAEKRGKTFNINMSDKAGKGTRKPQPQEPGKEKDKGSRQKADKEIGDN